MGELIPLFPLGTPLFPGIVLPLQIFERRYRRLMRDLLTLPEASDRRFFGVVAIRQGWEVQHIAPAEALYDVGCTARVQAVRPQADGGFRIVTVGGERFRLLDVVVADDPPYLQGEVEWLAQGGGAGGGARGRRPVTRTGWSCRVSGRSPRRATRASTTWSPPWPVPPWTSSPTGSATSSPATSPRCPVWAAAAPTTRSRRWTPRRPSCWTRSVTTRPHCRTWWPRPPC